jgi:membrane associated rhomboid family serine protease
MFFLIPVGVDYRARRYPMVTFTLMGICTVIYLVTLILRISNGDAVTIWVFKNLWLIPAESHWWAYITSMFVHEGFLHLLGNMIYLFLFGSCVEDIIGRVRFIVFYLLCGLIGCFTYIAMSEGHFASNIPMGGASGAISGCIGGFLLLLARTKIEFKWVIFIFFIFRVGELFLPAWVVISFWFLKDFASMVLESTTATHAGIAFGAHVGGTLAGLALIALDKPRLKRLEQQDEEVQELQSPQSLNAAATTRMRVKTPAPAIGETPDIYLFLDGAQAGPYTMSQIRQMFAAGAVSPDAFYWQQGMDGWRSADELREPGS